MESRVLSPSIAPGWQLPQPSDAVSFASWCQQPLGQGHMARQDQGEVGPGGSVGRESICTETNFPLCFFSDLLCQQLRRWPWLLRLVIKRPDQREPLAQRTDHLPRKHPSGQPPPSIPCVHSVPRFSVLLSDASCRHRSVLLDSSSQVNSMHRQPTSQLGGLLLSVFYT